MAEPHVVSALRAEYAEIAGEIEACHKRLKQRDEKRRRMGQSGQGHPAGGDGPGEA
jgi:hypothetical protein